VAQARELDAGELPEPVSDFITSGESLYMDRERAEKLLEGLIDDTETPLTAEMVDDYGGKEVLIERVTDAGV